MSYIDLHLHLLPGVDDGPPTEADALDYAAKLLGGGIDRIRQQMAAGAVLQVNVCSLLGMHGEEARAAANHLILSGMAYVVASDGHGRARNHTLADGLRPIREAGASAIHSWQL